MDIEIQHLGFLTFKVAVNLKIHNDLWLILDYLDALDVQFTRLWTILHSNELTK